ncbi:protein lin-54 homolog [Clonorchis sinensis]|uniref:Protein lin-54 homolog n=1 Tax=Clonorchis sinensis TaxID=79923 RepID=G7YEY3_CLOSI|nr:protein lin-54 homolog [Clonorchis sinensis]
MTETSTVGTRFLTSSTCPSSYSNYRPTHDSKSLKRMQDEEEVNRKVMEILRRMTAQQSDDTNTKSMNQTNTTSKSRTARSTKRPLAPDQDSRGTNDPSKIARLKVEIPPATKPPDLPTFAAKPIAPRPPVSTISTSQSPIQHPLKPHATLQNKPQQDSVLTSRRCSCSRSFCLKLYCECFAAGVFCSDCSCVGCYNLAQHENYRQKAIMRIVNRKPDAFQSKIAHSLENATVHARGCNCKRSGCLKNYCECYEARVRCTSRCRCQYCYNMPAASSIGHSHQMPISIDLSATSSLQEEPLFLHSPSSSPNSSSSTVLLKVHHSQEPGGNDTTILQPNAETSQPMDCESSSAQGSHRSSSSSVISENSCQDKPKDVHVPVTSVGTGAIPDQQSMPRELTILTGMNHPINPPIIGNFLPSSKTVIGLPAAIAASNLIATWLALLSNATSAAGCSTNPVDQNFPNQPNLHPVAVDPDPNGGLAHFQSDSMEQYTTEELAAFDRIIKQREQVPDGNRPSSEKGSHKPDSDTCVRSIPPGGESTEVKEEGSAERNDQSLYSRLCPGEIELSETLPSGGSADVAPKKVNPDVSPSEMLASEVARLKRQIKQLTRTVRKQGQMIRQLQSSSPNVLPTNVVSNKADT